MLYDLSTGNVYDIERFTEKVKEMLKKGAFVELKERKGWQNKVSKDMSEDERRTAEQNRFLHLILRYFGSEVGYNEDDVKYLFKWQVNPDIFVRVKVNKAGRQVQYTRSSADLSIDEMSLSITRFINYAAMEAGIYISSNKDDEQFKRHCEKVIEQNKEFL